jgi:hypothetical protein
MPIKVRCPDPSCDRVHLVKSKYAGMRGRCPNCGGWMMIPSRQDASAGAGGSRPRGASGAGLAESAPWAPVGVEGSGLRPDKRADASGSRKKVRQLLVSEEDEDADAEGPAPLPYFNSSAMALLLLAVLALGAVAGVVAPFVEQPSLNLTGDLARSHIADEKLGIREEGRPYLLGLPATASGLAFLAFFLSLVRRRFGVVSLVPAYLGLLVAWCMLVVAGYIFRDHLDRKVPRLEKEAETWKAQQAAKAAIIRAACLAWGGPQCIGDESCVALQVADCCVALQVAQTQIVLPEEPSAPLVNWGQSLFLGAGCSAAGFLLLSLALLFMHQNLGARLLFFLLASLLLAAAGCILFAGELGINFTPPFPV